MATSFKTKNILTGLAIILLILIFSTTSAIVNIKKFHNEIKDSISNDLNGYSLAIDLPEKIQQFATDNQEQRNSILNNLNEQLQKSKDINTNIPYQIIINPDYDENILAQSSQSPVDPKILERNIKIPPNTRNILFSKGNSVFFAGTKDNNSVYFVFTPIKNNHNQIIAAMGVAILTNFLSSGVLSIIISHIIFVFAVSASYLMATYSAGRKEIFTETGDDIVRYK